MRDSHAFSTHVARLLSAVLVCPVTPRALRSGREPTSTSRRSTCHRSVQQSLL